ncbi:hydroxymethylpyrimidine pyrophosphatase-like HAD family hydrolase [Cryobacterium mesophilum]|uniref:HAD family hydrolase n=1 Tax=Terrimesophilobacter mesophilus TaxID=433647 RepID=UPI00184C63C6|nr:HAD hydrolase family protein [Terrimesophilobacter mesophilus]MBB5632986.1 hydroxymethylpyrimidine pyrophosphatase-like HAD family hydrolase [Terrimesophilobacter mesophilus]
MSSSSPVVQDSAEFEPWLVALDIDGTVIHEDETLTDVVTQAVRSARDAGHIVTLATGRSWEMTKPILDVLELTPEYVVCANGAITLKRDSEVETGYRRELVETFDPGPVLGRIRDGLPGGRFLVEDATGHRYFTEGMQEWNLDTATQVEFDRLADRPVTRVVVVSPGQEPEQFLSLIDSLGLHQVSYAIGWTAWLDIAPDGVNKGTALERVRGILGVPKQRVFVAGDGSNDIEMFQWAGDGGRAIAMGQAADDLKAVATEVTGTVLEDGLVTALESLPGFVHSIGATSVG